MMTVMLVLVFLAVALWQILPDDARMCTRTRLPVMTTFLVTNLPKLKTIGKFMPHHRAHHPKSLHVSKTRWWAHDSKLHPFHLHGEIIAKYHDCLLRQHQSILDYYYEVIQQGFGGEAVISKAWNKLPVSLQFSFVRSAAYRAHYMLVNHSSTNTAPAIIGVPSLMLVEGSMPHPTPRQHVMTGEVLSQAALQLEIVVRSVLKLPDKWYFGRSQYLAFVDKPTLLVKALDNKYMASAANFWGCSSQVVDRYLRICTYDFVLTRSVNRSLLADFCVRNKLKVCVPFCGLHNYFDTTGLIALVDALTKTAVPPIDATMGYQMHVDDSPSTVLIPSWPQLNIGCATVRGSLDPHSIRRVVFCAICVHFGLQNLDKLAQPRSGHTISSARYLANLKLIMLPTPRLSWLSPQHRQQAL